MLADQKGSPCTVFCSSSRLPDRYLAYHCIADPFQFKAALAARLASLAIGEFHLFRSGCTPENGCMLSALLTSFPTLYLVLGTR